jgi:hypothetical protein
MFLDEELVTKQDYQIALCLINQQLEKAISDLNVSKKQFRSCYSEYINYFIRNDLKSKDTQIAYILKNKPQYEVIFDCLDDNQEEVNKLLRMRDDILKLMSMSQSELKLI